MIHTLGEAAARMANLELRCRTASGREANDRGDTPQTCDPRRETAVGTCMKVVGAYIRLGWRARFNRRRRSCKEIEPSGSARRVAWASGGLAVPTRVHTSHDAPVVGGGGRMEVGRIPSWDRAIVVAWWRWAGQWGRLGHREPWKWCAFVAAWKDGWWHLTVRGLHYTDVGDDGDPRIRQTVANEHRESYPLGCARVELLACMPRHSRTQRSVRMQAERWLAELHGYDQVGQYRQHLLYAQEFAGVARCGIR